MCGLAGILRPGGAPIAHDELTVMIDTIRHRGPDDDGTWCEGAVGLGFVRLSIQDLSPNGAQPMMSADERWVIAFNGEIFNFLELRPRLERAGRLRSTGDTEVLLEMIAERGIAETVAELEGDFAFAAWDRRERALHLVRDRHGVKPLYWSARDGELRFGSEMKAIVVARPSAPDTTTLTATLLGLSGTWGQATVFSGINAVRPGEWLEFRDSVEPRSRSFATVADFADEKTWRELRSLSDEAVVDRVGAALTRGTELRLISDAPVACLVSGGVDSSLITVLATERESDIGLYHADVVGDSERSAAEALASSVHGSLHVERVEDADILDQLAPVTWANEVPLTYHLNSVPFFLVSRRVREDRVKVLLTGEGSDEYFLGYPQLAVASLVGRVDVVKDAARGLLSRLSPRAADLFWPRRNGSYADALRELVFRFEESSVRRTAEEAFAFIPEDERRLHVLSLELAQNHLVSLLHRNDRLGMAWSLESRFPFLGHELARVAANLPGRHKLRRSWRVHDRRHPFQIDKWAVRAFADRTLPSTLAQREKQGFPVRVWDRIAISSEAFQDGFVVDAFGLDSAARASLVDDASPQWLLRVLLVDTWGRLFVQGESVDAVSAHLRRVVALRG